MIVGGYAVAFHGYPRSTKDIDVLVEPKVENAKRMIKALTRFFGSEPQGITEKKLTNPRTLIVLGVAPVRIDVLTQIEGIPSFHAAFRRRIKGKFGSVKSNYLCLDDLVLAKRSSGRMQDLADVEHLLQVNNINIQKKAARSK